MGIRDIKRAEALDRIADHMLSEGLAPSSLRALGTASGTSDRMLLYYFTDKDEIVTLALQAVCVRLARMLAEAVGEAPPLPPGPLLRQLAPLMRGAAFRPFMRLWLELAVLAAREQEPFRRVAGEIAGAFIAWVAGRLDVEDAGRHAEAGALVALLDGVILLDCVGKAACADAILARGDG